MSLARNALTAVLAMIVMTVLLGVAYPLAITGIGQVVFPANADGQQVKVDGQVVGSTLIGQSFVRVVRGRDGQPKLDQDGNPVTTPDRRYFQTRPSATIPPHNAAATTFSNLGPNNVTTADAIAANIKAYLALERPFDPGLTAARVPADAANHSASGIDPQISVANARIQARRVAAVRGLPLARVMALVGANTTGRTLGVFGEPGVNVLELNLAVDAIDGGRR